MKDDAACEVDDTVRAPEDPKFINGSKYKYNCGYCEYGSRFRNNVYLHRTLNMKANDFLVIFVTMRQSIRAI